MPLWKPNIAGLKAKRDVAGLMHALKVKETRPRIEAIQALGDLGDPAAIPALSHILANPQGDIAVQIEAASALGHLGQDAAIEPLVQATTLSRERERTLIDAAINSSDRRYREGFYINRISAGEYSLRGAIATALARIGGTRAVGALFEILASEKGAMESGVKNAVKSAIVDTLARMDAPVIPLLRDLLKADAAEARQWAAHCLGEFGDASAVEALIGAACDAREEFAVRETALISLGRIGDPRVIPYLEDLMDVEQRGLVQAARQCAMAIRMRMRAAQPDPADD